MVFLVPCSVAQVLLIHCWNGSLVPACWCCFRMLQLPLSAAWGSQTGSCAWHRFTGRDIYTAHAAVPGLVCNFCKEIPVHVCQPLPWCVYTCDVDRTSTMRVLSGCCACADALPAPAEGLLGRCAVCQRRRGHVRSAGARAPAPGARICLPIRFRFILYLNITWT